MTNELRRWRHRIDHGDVIQSPRGEYVLWADYDELAQAHMTLIGEFQAQEAELEALKHDNERLMKSLNAEVNAHEPSGELFEVVRDIAHPHIVTITPSSDAMRFGNWKCLCGRSMSRPMCGVCDNDE